MTGMSIEEMEPDLDRAVVRAKTLAALAHRGQFDRFGKPYIDHPRRVVGYLPEVLEALASELLFETDLSALSTLETITWLHNTIEHTWVTKEILDSMFDSIVVGAVARLTRGWFSIDNPTYEANRGIPEGSEYYRLIGADPWARIVQIADVLDHTEPNRLMAMPAQDRLRDTQEGWLSAKALNATEFVGEYNQRRWAVYHSAHPEQPASQD